MTENRKNLDRGTSAKLLRLPRSYYWGMRGMQTEYVFLED